MSYLRPAIIGLLAALALLPAAPAHAQDATGQIAFVSDRDGNREIYVMNDDGSGQTRLTDNPAGDFEPTWSPDGSRIAFTSDRDGNAEIYVMNADGSGLTRLTEDSANDFTPAWSPDGGRIAFGSDRDGRGEIFVMNADGSGQTNLTDIGLGFGFSSDPAWSPDGTRIALTGEGGVRSSAIVVINADGSNRTYIAGGVTPIRDSSPAWSPDGSRIAFVQATGVLFNPDTGEFDIGIPTPPTIYVMNADGSDVTALTDIPADDGDPTWSPDGSLIAFTSDRDGNSEIYVMNADGSGQTRLTENPSADSAPVWSPLEIAEPTPTPEPVAETAPVAPGDSATSKIAFVSDRDGNLEIYVMNADGSGQTNLTNNPAPDSAPAWSPDGSRIAFHRDGNGEIYVMNADGSGQTNLTNNPASDSQPAWSPDSSRIAFISSRDGASEIYVMNADGSGQTNLTDDPPSFDDPGGLSSGSDGPFTWSPDGSRIAFISNRESTAGVIAQNIYVMNADGSGLTNLSGNVTSDVRVGGGAWSPDGNRIATHNFFAPGFGYEDFASRGIGVVNVDGSAEIPLLGQSLESSTPSNFFPSWSPDGSRIAFLSDPDGTINAIDDPSAIYVMNADGSDQTRVTDSSARTRAPAWSPDGSRIAFHSERDGNREIYVMNADGSGQTRLTDNPAQDFDPVWSPGLVPTLAGAPQTAFVESVPGPDEISTDPEVVGSNIALTLFVIFTFAFTSALFNQTLSYNRREIEGWVGRFFTPLRRFSGIVEQRYGAVAESRPWIQRVAGPAVILLLTGLIYGFLSPDFGLNTKSAVLFVSMVVGVGGVTYVYAGGEALFTRRRFGLRAGVKLYAVALAIAVGSVLVSRLMDFQPGFLFGFVASYTLLATGALDRRQQGQTVLFAAIALLALSLIAWFLVIPLRDARQDSSVWWLALPEGTVVAMFVAGLQGVFFSMVPLSFMDGAKIAQWNRLLWLLLFGAAAFLFWHVLLNQEGAFLKALEQRRVVAALVLLSLYSIITLATWLYFRGRVYGWSLPSLLWGQAAPAGVAAGSGTVTTAQPTLRKSVPMPVFLAVIALAGVAIIAIGVLAFVSTGGGDEEPSVVAVAGTPTVAALPSPTPPAPTIAATPTFTTIDRAACDQPTELAELAQELAIIREKGYVVCDPSSYLPGGALHVLIGVLEDSSDSFTQWAFFFVGGEYLGTDSISTSVSITVVSQTSNTVTLSYAMFRPEDQACCPSAGEAIVPYDWDGTRLTPRVEIPPTDGPISRR